MKATTVNPDQITALIPPEVVEAFSGRPHAAQKETMQ